MTTCEPTQNPREVMTVPRTRDQLRQAAEAAERRLDEMDPAALNAPEADATALRRLGAAVRASEHDLADAVAAARRSGHPWRQIAAVLGTSRQAAQQKYGEPATTSR